MTTIPVALAATSSKWCSCDPVRIVSMISVAAAVIGIVAALFTAQIWAAIGFALLGAASLLLGHFAASNNAQLEKIKKEMTQDVSQLEAANQKMAGLTQQLAQQGQVFQQNRIVLEQQVSQYTRENQQLQSAQKQWEVQRQQLTANNQLLTQSKQGLEKDLAQLKQASDGLKAQVQQFLNFNIQMGQQVGAFEKGGTQLVQAEQTLQGAVTTLDERFDGNLAQLSQHLQLGKDAMQGIVQFISSQEQKGQKEINDLKAINGQLKTELDQLKLQQGQIQQRVTELEQLRKDLDEIQKTIAAQQQQIEQKTKDVTAATAKLEEIRKATEESVKNVTNLLHAKQQLLATINKKIDEQERKLKPSAT